MKRCPSCGRGCQNRYEMLCAECAGTCPPCRRGEHAACIGAGRSGQLSDRPCLCPTSHGMACPQCGSTDYLLDPDYGYMCSACVDDMRGDMLHDATD